MSMISAQPGTLALLVINQSFSVNTEIVNPTEIRFESNGD